MTDTPLVLVPHLMTRQKSADRARAVAAALREAVPDADVRVADSREASLELAREAEVIVCKGVTPELLDAAENLRWIQALSSGLDRFVTDKYGYEPPGLDRLERDGVALTNAAGVAAEPMAEQAFAYLLALERGLPTAVRRQDDGEWGGFGPAGELEGKTLGVVGVGSVGGRAAELACAFRMTVVGTKRDTDDVPDAVDEIRGADELDVVLPRSDYLLVSCPLTDETRGLIDADALAALPDDALLVNVARGEIVDEDALADALANGGLRGAGLDVFATEPLPADSPLWDLENAVLTPHYAGGSPRGDERMAALFARNYERLREGDLASLENRVA